MSKRKCPNPFPKGHALTALRKHHGIPAMPVYRAVQDALDDPTLIEGEKRAIIARTFEAISQGVNRRDEAQQPDAVTLGFCKLVTELYFSAENNPAKDAKERGTFKIKIVYDDERPNLGLVDPDRPAR